MLFGTDGIRGNAAIFVGGLAEAAGRAVATIKPNAKIMVTGDTRLSTSKIELQFSVAASQSGARVYRLGVMPTPCLAYLTMFYGADFGVMISASHNPPAYNGIKIVDGSGQKLSDERQEEIERLINQNRYKAGIGEVYDIFNADEDYLNYVVKSVDADLSDCEVTLDTCHGATVGIAAKLFKRLGAKVTTLCDTPNGELINVYSGSGNIEYLLGNTDRELGFAFDGDGDRVISTLDGQVCDGDVMLYNPARAFSENGKLKNNAVVGTANTNSVVKEELQKLGVGFFEAEVGDRNMLFEMQRQGLSLGGEKTGQIIIAGEVSTADGLLAAAHLAKIYKARGRDWYLSLKPYPQICFNVKAAKNLIKKPQIASQLEDCKNALLGVGRLVIRPSGTEPVVRVMVEAKSEAVANAVAAKVEIILSFKE